MPLYIVGTPIGNLKDITLRALEVFKKTDIFIVESYPDTRKLFHEYKIKPKEIIKYNEYNKQKVIPKIIDLLENNDAVFVTSAGMPSISDPGAELVMECHHKGIDVIPIPGPSALTTAVSASGIRAKRIIFIGFLPRKKSKIKRLINDFVCKDSLLVFFESPFRILKSLEYIGTINPDIYVFLAKEMTKKHETYIYGICAEIIDKLAKNKDLQKGEFTVLLSCDG